MKRRISAPSLAVRICGWLLCVGFLCSAGAAIAMPALAQSRDRETTAPVITDNDEPERFEVAVKGMYIILTSPKAVTVRLYSILGQLITQQPIQTGKTRIKAPGRGVYILKAGSATRRITV